MATVQELEKRVIRLEDKAKGVPDFVVALVEGVVAREKANCGCGRIAGLEQQVHAMADIVKAQTERTEHLVSAIKELLPLITPDYPDSDRQEIY